MIRANDSGLATAPAVVEDEPPAKKGLLTPRNVIVLVGVVAWIAVVVLFVLPRFTAKPAPAASAPGAAGAEAAAAVPATAARPAAISQESAAGGVTPPPPAVPAPVLPIAGRVFNLAGNGVGFKYLKLSIDIRFEDEKGQYAKAKADALKKLEDGFAADNAGSLGAFNDILTTAVSSRTAAELSTPKGKEALRTDLISQFNRALAAGGSKERVTYVSFNDFVMQ